MLIKMHIYLNAILEWFEGLQTITFNIDKLIFGSGTSARC